MMNPAQIARLRYQPEALFPLLSGLTEQQVRQQPQPGKWSIFEQIAHLGRYQRVFTERLEQIVHIESPSFNRYVAEEDPGFNDWLSLPIGELFRRIKTDREALNQLVAGYSDATRQRTGRHPLFGNMTIDQWTEFFLLHEAHHLFSILKIAAPFRNSMS